MRVALFLLPVALLAQQPTAEQAEFFEKKIRPVLAEKCYSCHNSKMKTPLGGLRLDTREGLLHGGDSGKVIAPGDPASSRLIQALSYRHELRMPPSGKLPDEQIANFTAWVRDGAPDSRTEVARPAPVRKGYDFAEGRKHWAFQPVKEPAVPAVRQRDWVTSPVDSFLLAKLEQQGLATAAPADKRALIRRVTFDLTGLPPSPAEVDAFVKDESPDAYTKVVERLLASPIMGSDGRATGSIWFAMRKRTGTSTTTTNSIPGGIAITSSARSMRMFRTTSSCASTLPEICWRKSGCAPMALRGSRLSGRRLSGSTKFSTARRIPKSRAPTTWTTRSTSRARRSSA
jgi:hypothetical protein